jgi:hypothetical protein
MKGCADNEATLEFGDVAPVKTESLSMVVPIEN